MSISIKTVELLVQAGVSGDALVAILRSLEADNAPPPPTAGALRVRRYRERGGGNIPLELRNEVLNRDQYTCQDCGSQDHLHIDHIRKPSGSLPGLQCSKEGQSAENPRKFRGNSTECRGRFRGFPSPPRPFPPRPPQPHTPPPGYNSTREGAGRQAVWLCPVVGGLPQQGRQAGGGTGLRHGLPEDRRS